MCLGSRWLRWHHVRIVNDYFSTRPCSQRLRQNGVSIGNDYADTQFSKYLTKFFNTFFVSILIFQKYNNSQRYSQKTCVHIVIDYTDTCPRSCWPRWHNVSEVIDYADTMSVQSTTTRTSCRRSRWLCWYHVCKVSVSDCADTRFSRISSWKVSKILWHCPFKQQILNMLQEYFIHKGRVMEHDKVYV